MLGIIGMQCFFLWCNVTDDVTCDSTYFEFWLVFILLCSCGLMKSHFGLVLLLQTREILAVLPVLGALIHGFSKQFLDLLSRTKSFTCPSLVFFTPTGVLYFLVALCMALWLSLLLPENGPLHLWHTIYQSCHIGIKVFNAMDQHSRVSSIMDCSQGSGL